MMRILFTIGILAFLAAPAHAQTRVERDFNTFVSWLSGSWDNEIQTFNENFSRLPDEMRHERIHMVYESVKADAFPGVLFVIKSYGSEGIRGPLNYVSVHHFFPNVDRGAIAHEFFFKKDGDWSYLADDPDAAAALTPDDVRFNVQCTMYWTKEAGQFTGTTDPSACLTTEDYERVLVEATGLLSRTDLWRRDMVFDRNGNKLSGLEEFEEFRAARYYSCSGRHLDNDGEWVYYDSLRVHNQGDLVWLGDKNLGVQIRQIVWQTGSFNNATVLQAFQNGNGRATVNAHGSMSTRFIGLDHPEFVVNCER